MKMDQTRQCRTCLETKPIVQFHRAPKAKDGRRRQCIPCSSAARGVWRKRNPPTVVAARRRYQEKLASDPVRLEQLQNARKERRLEKQTQRRGQNRDFEAQRAREYRNANLARAKANERKSYLKRRYGLSLDEIVGCLDHIGWQCEICGGPLRFDPYGIDNNTVNVDHDHITGEVRGILCGDCNHVLGRMRDDPNRLRRAAEYLDRHASKLTAGGDN